MKNKFLARRFKVGMRDRRNNAEERLGSGMGPDLVGLSGRLVNVLRVVAVL